MLKAEIINNVPYCPNCNVGLSNIYEYKEVEHDNKKYVEFIKECTKCNEKVKYQAMIDLDETIRFSFDDAKEIKEEKNTFIEEEKEKKDE